MNLATHLSTFSLVRLGARPRSRSILPLWLLRNPSSGSYMAICTLDELEERVLTAGTASKTPIQTATLQFAIRLILGINLAQRALQVQ